MKENIKGRGGYNVNGERKDQRKMKIMEGEWDRRRKESRKRERKE